MLDKTLFKDLIEKKSNEKKYSLKPSTNIFDTSARFFSHFVYRVI